MAKRIQWNERAKADVRAIDRQTAIDILHGIAHFASTGQGAVKRLQGIDPPEFRLRLGDYRDRYHDHGSWIEILRVFNRRNAREG